MFGEYRAFKQSFIENGVQGFRLSDASVKRMDAIKRSLERDGLTVQVHDTERQLLFVAKGDPKKRRNTTRPRTPHVEIMPSIVTSEQGAKRLSAALSELADFRKSLRERMRSQSVPKHVTSQNWAYYNRDKSERDKQQKIGHAIAKIVARYQSRKPYRLSQEDYLELDAAVGQKIRRKSQLPKHFDRDLLRYVAKTFARAWTFEKDKSEVEDAEPPVSIPNSVQRYQELALDVEYWTEMVRLLKDRSEKLAA